MSSPSSPPPWGIPDLAARVAANHADFRALAERDRRNVEDLAREMQTSAVIQVPYLDDDVHDLAGLMRGQPLPVRLRAAERVALAAER